MKYKKHIKELKRYIINDIDRSNYVRLDKNEFNVDFPEAILTELRNSLSNYLIQAYPSTYNTVDFAADLMDHADPSQVLVVAGSDYALKACYEAFVEEHQMVGMPGPTYAMNYVYSVIARSNRVDLPYGRDFQLDRNAFWETLDKISMLVLANPNQPTGRLESDGFISELLQECEKREIWVVIDEAYYSFSGYTAAKYINRHKNLVVLRSFSKSYGTAGMRLGGVLSQAENIAYLTNILPVYSVSSFALNALSTLKKHKPYFTSMHREMVRSRRGIIDFYNSIGCEAYESDTNFVMIECRSAFDTAKYIAFLKEEGILIRGIWNQPPYENAFRVTVSSLQNIERLKQSTLRFLKGPLS